jgi:hypothetical protein
MVGVFRLKTGPTCTRVRCNPRLNPGLAKPVNRLLVPATVFIALMTAECSDGSNSTGMNHSCTSACFTINGVEGDSPEAIEAKAKKACEEIGKKGRPAITERTKTAVAGHCTD